MVINFYTLILKFLNLIKEWHTDAGAEFQMFELSDVAVSTWVDLAPNSPQVDLETSTNRSTFFQSALYVPPAVAHLVNGRFHSF